MSHGQFGIPGQSAATTHTPRELFWGGDDNKRLHVDVGAVISSTAVDAGNSPTTRLRAGLIMGQLTSGGELVAWNPDATDGSENIYGINREEQKMTDAFGTAVDRWVPVTVRGQVRASQLLIEGTALVGDTDEFLARRLLHSQGFVLDDDPQGFKAGVTVRQSVKATDYTVVAADNGTRFYAITADATFTLPALKAGLEYDFIRASDHELVVASAEGDNMVVGNDLSADSVTFTTASEHIGAWVRVRGVYLNGTLKWLAELPQAPFGTAAGSAMTISIAT
jgi:hypothetical protein